jgi:hypothetical protein
VKAGSRSKGIPAELAIRRDILRVLGDLCGGVIPCFLAMIERDESAGGGYNLIVSGRFSSMNAD